SFHDPFVFLLHSNLDRLWAEWQADPRHPDRLTPATAYGGYSGAPSINEEIQPWAGDMGTGVAPLRPWAPPDNLQEGKRYKDLIVVQPPRYVPEAAPPTVSPRSSSAFAVSRAPDRMDVFWVGPDGAIGSQWWHGVPGENWDDHQPFPITPP